MQSYKFVRFSKILAIFLATVFYFSQAAFGQSEEQKLIELFGDADSEAGVFTAVTLGTAVSDFGKDDRFVVYGRVGDPTDRGTDRTTGRVPTKAQDAGIDETKVTYRPIQYANRLESHPEPHPERMPDLEDFFSFGGTLELLTTADSDLEKYDIVISEILWALDTGTRDDIIDIPSGVDDIDDDGTLFLATQQSQWIELYNTTDKPITILGHEDNPIETAHKLYLLFTPFASYPDREIAVVGGETYKVLDAVSNLLFGKWDMPGRSGRRPTTAYVSAYRVIDYDRVENFRLTRAERRAGVPFGSYEDSWEATPTAGRRNTFVRIIGKQFTREALIELPYIATPGTRHTPEAYTKSLRGDSIPSKSIVINEVRNDTSTDNVDWIELKNIGSRLIDLEEWELSIVTGFEEDTDLVDLPAYELGRGEILLILNDHPYFMDLADGINIQEPEEHRERRGLAHKYFIWKDLNLPNDKKFLLLLRSENDQNGRDEAIEDYAGNGFFTDTVGGGFTTEFWPRLAQRTPDNVAAFGENTFTSVDQAWARIRYEKDDGHHKEAWKSVKAQGGIGYAPNADLQKSPGTPGYDNLALKTQLKNAKFPNPDAEYTDGKISISEIMFDHVTDSNAVQWIELYNSSMTEAIDIKGWELDIRNPVNGLHAYVNGRFEFKDAVILPGQTLLLVTKLDDTNVPGNRLYYLHRHHRELGLRHLKLLSPSAFYLKFTDTADPEREGDDIVVDEVGNLNLKAPSATAPEAQPETQPQPEQEAQAQPETQPQSEMEAQAQPMAQYKLWELPTVNPQRRRSMVRVYGALFKPEEVQRPGAKPPKDGRTAAGWRVFNQKQLSLSYYGIHSDLGSPGYRLGGPLPVVLSGFRPVRTQTGEVRIQWRTASELNNAGFNLLRSESRDGEFTVINVKGVIPGQGTSSEMSLYSYTDTTAKPNVSYYYRIEDVAFDGGRRTLATARLKGEVSAADKLTTMWGSLKTR